MEAVDDCCGDGGDEPQGLPGCLRIAVAQVSC